MRFPFQEKPCRHRTSNCALAIVILLLCAGIRVHSQSAVPIGENDPVRLFQLAQDEHEHGNPSSALELYDAAIKMRPEFPEAEFQRGVALQQLKRYQEAEASYRRASELRPEWAQPFAALGVLLLSLDRQEEGAKALFKSVTLEPGNATAIRAFSNFPIPSKISHETLMASLGLMKTLTVDNTVETRANKSDQTFTWIARAMVEEALNDSDAAAKSFEQAIALDGASSLAFSRRAEFRSRLKDMKNAIADAEIAYKLSSHSVPTALLLANLYVSASRFEEALAVLNSLPEAAQRSTAALSLRESIVANTSEGPDARKTLEALVEKDPKNASLLARLGGMYRVDNPNRSLDYFRRAVEADPRNPNYATGYGSALVQAKRFADAAALLSQVVAADPRNYAAHANLATALYELKSYAGAISEYNWLLGVKPDLFVADFFIAISYDNLGQYEDALKYYEEFLAKADPAQNELEIEKVKLRLPALRNQIKRGAGVKPQKRK